MDCNINCNAPTLSPLLSFKYAEASNTRYFSQYLSINSISNLSELVLIYDNTDSFSNSHNNRIYNSCCFCENSNFCANNNLSNPFIFGFIFCF